MRSAIAFYYSFSTVAAMFSMTRRCSLPCCSWRPHCRQNPVSVCPRCCTEIFGANQRRHRFHPVHAKSLRIAVVGSGQKCIGEHADFSGRLRRLLGQLADLVSNHRKSCGRVRGTGSIQLTRSMPTNRCVPLHRDRLHNRRNLRVLDQQRTKPFLLAAEHERSRPNRSRYFDKVSCGGNQFLCRFELLMNDAGLLTSRIDVARDLGDEMGGLRDRDCPPGPCAATISSAQRPISNTFC